MNVYQFEQIIQQSKQEIGSIALCTSGDLLEGSQIIHPVEWWHSILIDSSEEAIALIWSMSGSDCGGKLRSKLFWIIPDEVCSGIHSKGIAWLVLDQTQILVDVLTEFIPVCSLSRYSHDLVIIQLNDLILQVLHLQDAECHTAITCHNHEILSLYAEDWIH